jgi:hypothetical protein
LAQLAEVVGAKVGHQPLLAERGNDFVGRGFVVRPREGGEPAFIDAAFLGVQEVVNQVLDRQGLGVLARLAAGVQVVLLRQVLLQGGVGVVPRAEVVELTPDGFWGLEGLPAALRVVESLSDMVTCSP